MSNKPNDGGPAFPMPAVFNDGMGVHQQEYGMTLRDKFADSAMPELLAECLKTNMLPLDKEVEIAIAMQSYSMADAMILARDNGQKKLTIEQLDQADKDYCAAAREVLK